MINVYRPYLPLESIKYAHHAIDSGWLSSQGEYKEKAEDKIKELLGVKYVLLLNSGTAAVHLMSRYLFHTHNYIKNIIVPSNVYVAAWNGFLFDKKHRLLPIDANINTWCMDTDRIGNIDYQSVILAVHNVSSIVNVPELKRKYKQTIILEDACEGFLGTYEGKYVGTEALCSSISFFGNKSITSGEGGALLTNNKDVYDYTKKLHGQGQSNVRYIHDDIGYNYRLTNVQAAILYGQLEVLPEIIEKKKHVFNLYKELTKDIPNVQLQQPTDDTESSNWMMGARIINMNRPYCELEKHFNDNAIEIRPMFYPMSKHSYLKDISITEEEVVAEILSKECFMLPSYPELEDYEIEKVVSVLKNYVEKILDI
jgi:perosamine synthetase